MESPIQIRREEGFNDQWHLFLTLMMDNLDGTAELVIKSKITPQIEPYLPALMRSLAYWNLGYQFRNLDQYLFARKCVELSLQAFETFHIVEPPESRKQSFEKESPEVKEDLEVLYLLRTLRRKIDIILSAHPQYEVPLDDLYNTTRIRKDCPVQIHKIANHLFISDSVYPSTDLPYLRQLKIEVVINVASEYEYTLPAPFIYHHALIGDGTKIPPRILQEIYPFIDAHIRVRNVVVHCVEGKSRSGGVVVGQYWRTHPGLTWAQAQRAVKRFHYIIPHPLIKESICQFLHIP